TRFKYAYLGPNNKVMYNEIFKNLVASFKFNYYSEDLLQASKSSKKKNKDKDGYEENKPKEARSLTPSASTPTASNEKKDESIVKTKNIEKPSSNTGIKEEKVNPAPVASNIPKQETAVAPSDNSNNQKSVVNNPKPIEVKEEQQKSQTPTTITPKPETNTTAPKTNTKSKPEITPQEENKKDPLLKEDKPRMALDNGQSQSKTTMQKDGKPVLVINSYEAPKVIDSAPKEVIVASEKKTSAAKDHSRDIARKWTKDYPPLKGISFQNSNLNNTNAANLQNRLASVLNKGATPLSNKATNSTSNSEGLKPNSVNNKTATSQAKPVEKPIATNPQKQTPIAKENTDPNKKSPSKDANPVAKEQAVSKEVKTTTPPAVAVANPKNAPPQANPQNAANNKSIEPTPTNMKLRIGFYGGIGQILKNNNDTSPFGLYKEKLNRGWNLGADVTYFIRPAFGLGLKYQSYHATNTSDKLDFKNPISDEQVKSGAISNRITTNFVGPTLAFRKSISYKSKVVFSASPGINLYVDKGNVNENKYTQKGNSFGGIADLSFDFMIGNDIYGRDIILSLGGGYTYGSIASLKTISTGATETLSSPLNISRLDVHVGLRFTRFPMTLR
ncbi:MAG: hypothetical protein ACRCVT_09120, partial [Leadbetterella sp.]